MSWKKSNTFVLTLLVVCSVVLLGYRYLTDSTEEYTVEVFQVDEGSYGYKITRNEQLLIVQPFIPGVPGKRPFITDEEARRVGEYVCRRMQTEGMYAVTVADLSELNISY